MDGVFSVCLALLYLFLFKSQQPSYEEQRVQSQAEELCPTTNPDFKHDEHAFMAIANELGFH